MNGDEMESVEGVRSLPEELHLPQVGQGADAASLPSLMIADIPAEWEDALDAFALERGWSPAECLRYVVEVFLFERSDPRIRTIAHNGCRTSREGMRRWLADRAAL